MSALVSLPSGGWATLGSACNLVVACGGLPSNRLRLVLACVVHLTSMRFPIGGAPCIFVIQNVNARIGRNWRD